MCEICSQILIPVINVPELRIIVTKVVIEDMTTEIKNALNEMIKKIDLSWYNLVSFAPRYCHFYYFVSIFREMHEKDGHRDRDKIKEMERSPIRRRSKSPMKRRLVRYAVKVPSELLNLSVEIFYFLWLNFSKKYDNFYCSVDRRLI